MKTIHNEGYGLTHTVWMNVNSVMMMAIISLICGYMGLMIAVFAAAIGMPIELADEMLHASMVGLVGLLVPGSVLAALWAWSDSKASEAFEDHLAQVKADIEQAEFEASYEF